LNQYCSPSSATCDELESRAAARVPLRLRVERWHVHQKFEQKQQQRRAEPSVSGFAANSGTSLCSCGQTRGNLYHLDVTLASICIVCIADTLIMSSVGWGSARIHSRE